MPPVESPAATVLLSRFLSSPLDLARRAHALLAERFPPAKVRHKPLSILRQEGRRAVELYLDTTAPNMPRPDRDKIVEEVLGEAVGFGPLEELFRDESVKEIMLLTAAQVIVNRGSGWVPTSVRFRDPAHHRGYLRRVADISEHLAGGLDGAFDVRLSNGFRVVGVVPPEVLDLPPLAVFARASVPQEVLDAPPLTSYGSVPEPPPGMVSGNVRMSALSRGPTPAIGSGTVSMSALQRSPSAGMPSGSGRVEPPQPRPLPMPVAEAPVSEFFLPSNMDPMERVRRRVRERLVRQCAAAGVYDLFALPTAELQRIIQANVDEVNTVDKLNLPEQTRQVLALEVLSGMRR